MTIPEFLRRREPSMQDQQPRSARDEETESVVASIVATRRERDAYREQAERGAAIIDEQQREIDFLREQLRVAEHKRDMFQRHALALYTRIVDEVPYLRNRADVLQLALDEARIEATSGGAAGDLPDVAFERELARRLAPENEHD
jgi:hypothetical protein